VSPRAIAIIPARLGSTRLPGKVLAPLGGQPVLGHVVAHAQACARLGRVVVASGDAEITAWCRGAGVEVVDTPPGLPSGTDRVAHALRQLGDPAEIILNLQADEPFVLPGLLASVVEAAAHPQAAVGTAWAPGDAGDIEAEDRVKIAVDPDGWVRGFSRRGWASGPVRLHVGLYAYRRAALAAFAGAAPHAEELAQRLEQLRLFHAGAAYRAVPAGHVPLSIDTPADLARARARVGPLENP
jgi:3-deoxy-manno-octulosonate cytidylyltransferase (CMP-KDO synthetase)